MSASYAAIDLGAERGRVLRGAFDGRIRLFDPDGEEFLAPGDMPARIEATGRRFDCIHVIGGGARNRLLCELTADVTCLPVVVGPTTSACSP